MSTTTNLKLETFTSSPETFSVTSTLVTGERDALLVDGQFALPQAELLTERIKASGKRLRTIYVTHVWLSETTPAQWQEWLRNLDRLEAVGAGRVVSGHRVADAVDDARAFAGTRDYIRDYAAAVEASSSREELIERVKAKHGDR